MGLEIPIPLPDELLYSAIARGLSRTGVSHRAFSLEVLGRQTPINPLCPENLEHLTHRIYPLGAGIDAQRLSREATMAATILPFMSETRRTAALMTGIPPGATSSHYRDVSVRGLRCCPKCMTEDRATYGEAYWRRHHQIDAARVCLKHRTALLIGASPSSIRSRYVALDAAKEFTPACSLAIKLNANWRITRQVATLFLRPVMAFSREAFADRVTARMDMLGNQVFGSRELSQVLLSRFGASCFQELGLEVTNGVCKDAVRVMGFAKDAARAHFYAMIAERCRESLASMLSRCTHSWTPEAKESQCMNGLCDSREADVIVDVNRKEKRTYYHFHCRTCGQRYVRVRPLAKLKSNPSPPDAQAETMPN